jgi:hypothetical protein
MKQYEKELTTIVTIISLLIFHYIYFFNHQTLREFHYTIPILDDFYQGVMMKTFLCKSRLIIKVIQLLLIASVFFIISPKKSIKSNLNIPLVLAGIGFAVFLIPTAGIVDIAAHILGIILLISASYQFKRHLDISGLQNDDKFNKHSESFPQNDVDHKNEDTDDHMILNLDGTYFHENKVKKVFLPVVNPYRATVVLGTPGAGKTFSVLLTMINQFTRKNAALYVYDYKYPELAIKTLMFKNANTQNTTSVKIIAFNDLRNSSRCNILNTDFIPTKTHALEISKIFYTNANKSWVGKEGEFFSESAYQYLSMIIWFFKNYKGGIYSTFPHVCKFATSPIELTFPILQASGIVDDTLGIFKSALEREAYDQLMGQVASATIPLTAINSPDINYILSGDDVNLEINDINNPTTLIIGNDEIRRDALRPVLGLLHGTLISRINQEGPKHKMGLVMDEFSSTYVKGIDHLISVARSRKIATVLGFQDLSQLERDYSKQEANTIYNLIGSIFCGNAKGNTAEEISKIMGSSNQEKQSYSMNPSSADPNISLSTNLQKIVPVDTIANLSQGQFVGVLADDYKYPIERKKFHCDMNIPAEIFEIDKKSKTFKDTYRFPNKSLNPEFKDLSDLQISNIIRKNEEKLDTQIKELFIEEINNIYTDETLSKYLIKNYNYRDYLI